MDLKIRTMQNKWTPSDELRYSARLDPSTIFQDTIRSVETVKSSANTLNITLFNIIAVSAHECRMLKQIPRNLRVFFPNIIALDIKRCGINKITRNDLKGLEALREIALRGLEIEVLPSDLFTDLKNLEVIELMENKIKFIGRDTFKHLTKLKFVDLSGNPSINLLFAVAEYYDTQKDYGVTRIFKLNEFNAIIDGIYQSAPDLSSEVQLDVSKVFKSDDFKDFVIKIDENEFKVHKLMLAARSPTLAEMIKNNPDAEELILTDIDVETFKIIRDYIYDGKFPTNNDENLQKIFAAAGKLKLEKLRIKCGQMLCETVDRNNSLELLKMALKNNHDELKQKCIEEIKKIFADSIYSFDDKIYENIELLQVIVEEKLNADERIQKTIENFHKFKV